MRPSKFNVFIPLPSDEGEHLVYNTLTDSRATVGEELKRAMEQARRGGVLDSTTQLCLEPLRELGIVVDDDEDEDRTAREWLERIKQSTETFDVTVLTTYACNLACDYCFEKRIGSTVRMDAATCRQVSAWIVQRLDRVRPERLRLTFYGGEPLLHPAAVTTLGAQLNKEAAKRGVELEIILATNGVLLSRETVLGLLPYGLSTVKVTLDGDGAAHDARRPLRNGGGSFRAIFSNLQQIKDLVSLVIVGNYDAVQQDGIPALLDRLQAAGFGDAIREIGFRPILTGLGAASVAESPCAVCALSDGEVEDLLRLAWEVRQRGFSGREMVSVAPCIATREHSCVIDPQGKIYKCPAFLGRDELAVGDVSVPSFNPVNARFVAETSWPACRECEYYPLCDGGCRSSAYLKGGDIGATACERPFFERVAMKWVEWQHLAEEREEKRVSQFVG